MKEKIHPKVNKVVFLDVMSGAEFISTSTLKSEETKKIDGVEHFVIRVETSSASHPFYTGKRRNEMRNDQVAKFIAKVAKAQDKNKPKTVKEDQDGEPKKATAKKTTKKAKKA
jgi:large subunit ribosomal protein L31